MSVSRSRPHPWNSDLRSRDRCSAARSSISRASRSPGANVAAEHLARASIAQFPGSTDREGRFVWRSAPSDVVALRVGKFGYMSSETVPLTASDRSSVITLYPELVISGRVTDARDRPAGAEDPRDPGAGNPRARKRPIGPRTRQWKSPAGDTRLGSTKMCEPSYVRVEAAGHQPAVSRAFRSTEGTQAVDFALAARRGSVVRGRPAPRWQARRGSRGRDRLRRPWAG